MKRLVLLLALLIAPVSFSTAFAGSCGGGDHTHTDEKKKPSNRYLLVLRTHKLFESDLKRGDVLSFSRFFFDSAFILA